MDKSTYGLKDDLLQFCRWLGECSPWFILAAVLLLAICSHNTH